MTNDLFEAWLDAWCTAWYHIGLMHADTSGYGYLAKCWYQNGISMGLYQGRLIEERTKQFLIE